MKMYEQLTLCLPSGKWLLSHENTPDDIDLKYGLVSPESWIIPICYLMELYGVKEIELITNGIQVHKDFEPYCQRKGIRIIWK